jgi:hypothetical protein
MASTSWLWAGVAVAAAALGADACGGSTSTAAGSADASGGGSGGSGSGAGSGGGGTGASEGGAASECPPCVTDADCNGGSCAQLGGDAYCAPPCGSGGACAADRTCAAVTGVSGDQVSLCIPKGGVCASVSPPADAGGASAEECGTLVGPDVPAGCHCASGHTCGPNNCYGGFWCNTATNRCQAPPAGCAGAADAGVYDGGAPPTGSVGPGGGSVSRLYFAVVGDTRPPSPDDTAAYPTAVITQIYSHIAALSPQPTFAVSSGDYMFASPGGSEGATQLDLYLGARAKYPGPLFPAMGNHECTGYTNSNCGAGNPDGTTSNFSAFLSKLLGPIQQTSPYYEIDVGAADASWTAKLLFVAANAWTQTQADWLDRAMAKTTTYTFVVRHEAASANTAPGVTPSENILSMHPYTLAIVGHTHTYERSGPREVIIGNGGAPLTGGKNYGFGVVNQRADGAIVVDMVDYASGLADASFHFAVKADGSATQ